MAPDEPQTLQGGRKMIDNVSKNQVHSTVHTHQTNRAESLANNKNGKSDSQINHTDIMSIEGDSSLPGTYSSNMKMLRESDHKYGMLQSLVADLLKEQGIDTNVMIGDTSIDIADLSQKEAQELISEDGYFGVKQTSERIFQFAVGVAGGDPSRIDAIKEGVEKGFNEALEAFGGTLPEISYETYDAVMEKLDNWVSESGNVA